VALPGVEPDTLIHGYAAARTRRVPKAYLRAALNKVRQRRTVGWHLAENAVFQTMPFESGLKPTDCASPSKIRHSGSNRAYFHTKEAPHQYGAGLMPQYPSPCDPEAIRRARLAASTTCIALSHGLTCFW